MVKTKLVSLLWEENKNKVMGMIETDRRETVLAWFLLKKKNKKKRSWACMCIRTYNYRFFRAEEERHVQLSTPCLLDSGVHLNWSILDPSTSSGCASIHLLHLSSVQQPVSNCFCNALFQGKHLGLQWQARHHKTRLKFCNNIIISNVECSYTMIVIAPYCWLWGEVGECHAVLCWNLQDFVLGIAKHD